MENLFVYGTLKSLDLIKKLLGRKIPSADNSLHGYCLGTVRIDDQSYPKLSESYNMTVSGLVLLVTDEELRLLDEYETSAYKREKAALSDGTIAWVYK